MSGCRQLLRHVGVNPQQWSRSCRTPFGGIIGGVLSPPNCDRGVIMSNTTGLSANASWGYAANASWGYAANASWGYAANASWGYAANASWGYVATDAVA